MYNNTLKRDITLDQSNNIEEFNTFAYEFEIIVNEITIEAIGEHEESIIIKNIRLGG